MPIQHLLESSSFTPEQQRVIECSFDATLKKLHLVDRNDPICEIVAQKVIDVASSAAIDATDAPPPHE